jgi:uncharacterized protein (TIGR03083 family)
MFSSSAARAEHVDCGELYEQNRRAFIAIVRDASADELSRRVAATPAWSVRDVLSHVVGIPADLNAQEFGHGDAEEWTGRQVEKRRGLPTETVIEEWDREAPTFEDGLALFGYEFGSHYVGDLYTHMQDVRSTVGLPRGSDERTVLVALDFYLFSLDEALRDSDQTGAVEIVAGDEHHVVGSGTPVATLGADPFEILRTLSGRRSLNQIRSLPWTGEVDLMAPLLSRYPLPETDLPA